MPAVDEKVDAGVEDHKVPHKHVRHPPARGDVEPDRERERLPFLSTYRTHTSRRLKGNKTLLIRPIMNARNGTE